MQSKYLITGGAGFIGSNLINNLLNNGNRVICIDDLSSGLSTNLPSSHSLNFIKNKIQNVHIDEIDKDIKGIFHLAAQASVPLSISNFYQSSTNNLLGTLKIWDLAIRFNVPIVYASSSAVYGNMPIGNDCSKELEIISPYAQDKLTMENYASMCYDVFKTSSFGLRLFNVYGPRQDPTNSYSGVISIFIDRLLKSKSVTVKGGHQTRDFIYVDDVVKIMLESMDYLYNNRSCEVCNIGTGISVTIDNLLAALADIIQTKPKINLKALPPGDPVKSGGTYEKLKNVLNIDINQFLRLEDGSRFTIDYIMKEQEK